MNINESIRDLVNHHKGNFTSLADLQILTMGETDEVSPPCLTIEETGADMVEQGEVILHGVTAFEITCKLHTVPAEADEGGTPTTSDREMRRDLYDILGDRDNIPWLQGRNGWTVFDIRLASPTSTADDGRRISTFVLTVIACPT